MIVSYGVVALSVLSFSAIASNGNAKRGGAYCMLISTHLMRDAVSQHPRDTKSLGPEFGSAVGVMYYLSNLLSAALVLLVFGELITIVTDLTDRWWAPVLFGSLLLLAVAAVTTVGVQLFVWTNFTLFSLLCICIIPVIGGFLFRHPYSVPIYSGWRTDVFLGYV